MAKKYISEKQEEFNHSKEWKLDKTATFIANLLPMLFLLIVLIFIVYGATFMASIENDNTQIIFSIVYLYSVIRVISLSVGVSLHYKPRE